MPTPVLSEISGIVWRIEAAEGGRVAAGDVVIIIESMKMEIPIEAPAGGVFRLVAALEQCVQEGDVLGYID